MLSFAVFGESDFFNSLILNSSLPKLLLLVTITSDGLVSFDILMCLTKCKIITFSYKNDMFKSFWHGVLQFDKIIISCFPSVKHNILLNFQ